MSIGKPQTLVRAQNGAPWTPLVANEPHVLSSGEQIGLYSENPDGAFFTIMCEADTGGGMGGGAQYSDDGQWMWDGAQWIPAR